MVQAFLSGSRVLKLLEEKSRSNTSMMAPSPRIIVNGVVESRWGPQKGTERGERREEGGFLVEETTTPKRAKKQGEKIKN